jgi:hypothetical protein
MLSSSAYINHRGKNRLLWLISYCFFALLFNHHCDDNNIVYYCIYILFVYFCRSSCPHIRVYLYYFLEVLQRIDS